MTVAELIEKLKAMPQEAQVWVGFQFEGSTPDRVYLDFDGTVIIQ